MRNPATLLAFAAASLLTSLLGQTAEQDINRFRADAAIAKTMSVAAAAITIDDDSLPAISGAAIVVAGGVNADPKRVIEILINDPRGQYYVRGILADGANTPIPLSLWNFSNPTPLANLLVMNGNASEVFPGMNQIWKVELIHFYNGSIEKLSAICGPYQDQSSGLNLQIGADQIVNGDRYSVGLGGNTEDITAVGVGLYGLATAIQQYPGGGAIAVFPSNFFFTGGATSITVCKRSGWCYTDTFKPKALLPTGKG